MGSSQNRRGKLAAKTSDVSEAKFHGFTWALVMVYLNYFKQTNVQLTLTNIEAFQRCLIYVGSIGIVFILRITLERVNHC